MTQYIPVEIYLTENQQRKVHNAIEHSQECTLRINPSTKGNSKLLFTQSQINKLENSRMQKRSVDITFSKAQLKHQEGGLLPLVAAALPLLFKGALAGAASAAAAKVVNKISGKGTRIIGKKYDGQGTRIIGKKYGNGSKNG